MATALTLRLREDPKKLFAELAKDFGNLLTSSSLTQAFLAGRRLADRRSHLEKVVHTNLNGALPSIQPLLS